MITKVTKKQAEQALAQIKKQYKGYWVDEMDAPKLIKEFSWTSSVVDYAIAWESGPYEWVHSACQKIQVEGLEFEPYTSWALAIYKI